MKVERNPFVRGKQHDKQICTSLKADKFVVRLPQGLRERINEASGKNHRSMNGQIVARIDGSLDLERKYEEMRQLNSLLSQRLAILEAAAQP